MSGNTHLFSCASVCAKCEHVVLKCVLGNDFNMYVSGFPVVGVFRGNCFVCVFQSRTQTQFLNFT